MKYIPICENNWAIIVLWNFIREFFVFNERNIDMFAFSNWLKHFSKQICKFLCWRSFPFVIRTYSYKCVGYQWIYDSFCVRKWFKWFIRFFILSNTSKWSRYKNFQHNGFVIMRPYSHASDSSTLKCVGVRYVHSFIDFNL